jgi:hypothetical protein
MTNSFVDGFEESRHVLVRSASNSTCTCAGSEFEKFSLTVLPSKFGQPLIADWETWERQPGYRLETL